SFAQKDQVVAGEDAPLEGGKHCLVEADEPGEQVIVPVETGEEVPAELLLHGPVGIARGAKLRERRGRRHAPQGRASSHGTAEAQVRRATRRAAARSGTASDRILSARSGAARSARASSGSRVPSCSRTSPRTLRTRRRRRRTGVESTRCASER